MNGKDLVITLNGTAIAAAKSCEIDVQASTEDLASFGYTAAFNVWKRTIVTQKAWSVTVNKLVTSDSVAGTDLLRVGYEYTLRVKGASSQTATLVGSAICTRAKVTAPIGSLVQGSFVFEGNGELAAPSS